MKNIWKISTIALVIFIIIMISLTFTNVLCSKFNVCYGDERVNQAITNLCQAEKDNKAYFKSKCGKSL